MPRIVDPEVRLLAGHSRELQPEYPKNDAAWKGSPFAWIWARSSRQKGAIGEKLVSNYLASKNFRIERSPDQESDRIINGSRAEIKCSMLWASGMYKFQQLRDQNYEFAICLGLSPFDVHCWVLPKTVIMQKWKSGEIGPQHRGQSGTDTAWLEVSPDDTPEWLQAFGGKLSEAVAIVSRLTQQVSRF